MTARSWPRRDWDFLRKAPFSSSWRDRIPDVKHQAVKGTTDRSRRQLSRHFMCRRGDLKGYSPLPEGGIIGPELWLPAA